LSIWSLALTFFLVANPIGNSPAVLALIKKYSFDRQKKIVIRETLFALIIALFFQFFGEYFLDLLHVSHAALALTGGLVLFLVALQMLFHQPDDEGTLEQQEPFIVPIALPLVSGPGLMTMIMVNAAQEADNFKITSAILIAWVGVALVLVTSPYLNKIVGKHGMAALEQVMGMVLGLLSVQMLVSGLQVYIQTLNL